MSRQDFGPIVHTLRIWDLRIWDLRIWDQDSRSIYRGSKFRGSRIRGKRIRGSEMRGSSVRDSGPSITCPAPLPNYPEMMGPILGPTHSQGEQKVRNSQQRTIYRGAPHSAGAIHSAYAMEERMDSNRGSWTRGCIHCFYNLSPQHLVRKYANMLSVPNTPLPASHYVITGHLTVQGPPGIPKLIGDLFFQCL
jgi:hypothetical protein